MFFLPSHFTFVQYHSQELDSFVQQMTQDAFLKSDCWFEPSLISVAKAGWFVNQQDV